MVFEGEGTQTTSQFNVTDYTDYMRKQECGWSDYTVPYTHEYWSTWPIHPYVPIVPIVEYTWPTKAKVKDDYDFAIEGTEKQIRDFIEDILKYQFEGKKIKLTIKEVE